MVSRRAILTGGAALGAGALVGCSTTEPNASSTPGAAQSSTTPSSTSPSSTAGPSATPSSASPTARATASETASASASPSATGKPEPEVTDTVADNLDVPWGIVFLPSGEAIVGERNSAELVRISTRGKKTRMGEVSGVQAPSGLGEGGLLGLALDPDDPDVLFAYLTSSTDNRVVSLSIADGQVGKPKAILTGIPTSTHHHGGKLLFAPDKTLFVSAGDAENSANAQRTGSLAGKILRITRSGKAAGGNPFGNRTWSYGHRNIEGLAFDADGRLWATEFGDKSADELNLITKGENYGWPNVEGRSSNSRYVSPKATWSPTSSCSPAGLAITRNTAFVGALQGKCLFSVSLDGTDAGTPKRHFAGDHGRIRSVVVAPDGALWMTTSNTDGRVTPGRTDDKILRVGL